MNMKNPFEILLDENDDDNLVFYDEENNKLEFVKGVGHDRGAFNSEDGTYEYDKHMVWDNNDNTKYITEEQERAYFNNVIRFRITSNMKRW